MIRYATVAALLLPITLTGCGAVQNARSTAKKVQSENNMKQLALGMLSYRSTIRKWPDRIEDISREVEGEENLKELMTNPVTGDNPGYEYVKPAGVATSNTVILYQLRDGKRDPTLSVAYADGSVRPLGE